MLSGLATAALRLRSGQARAETLTVDGRHTTMTATKAPATLVTASMFYEAATQSTQRGPGLIPRHLNTVYHRSVCPKRRLSAKTGQFLTGLKVHSPGQNGRQNARHTLTVDRGYTVMILPRLTYQPDHRFGFL